jgi:hypothetical protein
MNKIKEFIYKHPMFTFYVVCIAINRIAGTYGEPSLNKFLTVMAIFGLLLPTLKKKGILK